jgi:Domain of unknown function (DUF6468)
MSNALGMTIEILVAILLMVTVGYCMLLNRRLKRLKADEHSLRATISELVTATEIAERAIAGLKITVRECDIGLGQRLSRAETLSADFDRRLNSGRDVLNRLSQIVLAGKGGNEPEPAPPPPAPLPQRNGALAVAAAAQAMSDRLRMKVHGLAA